MSRSVLVSACLLGLNTRYNRIEKPAGALLELLRRHRLTPVPVCPEQLAGLPTPRPAARFTSGDGVAVLAGRGTVGNDLGEDVTQTFLAGAEQTLLAAEIGACRIAILKERSPSCGVRQVYLKDRVVPGSGIATARVQAAGLQVFSEEELDRLERYLLGAGGAGKDDDE